MAIWLPLLTGCVTVTLQLLSEPESLSLSVDQIGAEPWRLLSAHFIHLGWVHLALNLTGVIILWALFGDWQTPFWWATAAVTIAIGLSAALIWLTPMEVWYVGLSGVLHGLFAAAAIASLPTLRRLGQGVLLVMLLKLLVEQFSTEGDFIASLIGGPVVLEAHLIGTFLGIGYGIAALVWTSRRVKHHDRNAHTNL